LDVAEGRASATFVVADVAEDNGAGRAAHENGVFLLEDRGMRES